MKKRKHKANIEIQRYFENKTMPAIKAEKVIYARKYRIRN